MEDLVIIGAGPIGLYGAILAALHNLKGKVIESSSFVGGQLSSLYPEKNIVDLPGFSNITASKFIANLEEQFYSNSNHLLMTEASLTNCCYSSHHWSPIGEYLIHGMSMRALS